jgi:hypothetical protein
MALVQTSAVSYFAATLATSTTLTGVTSGNTLILLVTHANFSANNGSTIISASDSQGTYGIDQESGGARYSCDMMRLPSANAGTHTVTATANYGTAANSFGQMVLTEWSGLNTYDASTGVDNEGSQNTGPVSSGATGLLSSAADVAIAISLLGDQTGSYPVSGWGTPSGWISIYQDTTNNHLPTSMAYKVLSSNAGVAANFGTLATAGEWAAIISAYTPSGGGGGANGRQMMLGMGS